MTNAASLKPTILMCEFLAFAVLSAAPCTAGSTPSPPIPAAKSETMPGPAIFLNLKQCLGIVIRNSTSVLERSNQMDLTGDLVLEAYGQFLPNVSASAGYGYVTGTTLYHVQGRTVVTLQGQNASLNLSSSLNLFNGLADYAGLKSALARRSASEYSVEWAKEQVALDLIQTYLQFSLDMGILDIANKNLAAAQARLRLLQGQSQVGSASLSDLYRQQAEASAAEFAVANDEARVQDDRVLLIRKLRVDPSQDYRFELPSLEPTSSPLLSQGVDQLVKQTLDKRADVQSNSAFVQSSDWDVTRAKSGYLPRLDVVFTRYAAGLLPTQETANGVDVLAPYQPGLGAQLGNQVQYSIGLALTWNLFDRFVTHYDVSQANTLLRDTQIHLEDSKLQVQADIRTAYTNLSSARKQLASTKVGLKSAEQSYDAVEGMYEEGSASIVDVLTAQTALVLARTELAEALTNLKLQEKALAYATGMLLSEEGLQ